VHADTPRFALPLSVEGNRIVDANDSTVILNGIHRDGSQGEKNDAPRFPSAEEMSWVGRGHGADSWNAGVVRVPVGSEQWTGTGGLYTDNAAYRTSVDAECQAITGQGSVALLDLHAIAPACRSGGPRTTTTAARPTETAPRSTARRSPRQAIGGGASSASPSTAVSTGDTA
jgi:hypothetical protein